MSKSRIRRISRELDDWIKGISEKNKVGYVEASRLTDNMLKKINRKIKFAKEVKF